MNASQRSRQVLVVGHESLAATYVEYLLNELGFSDVYLAHDLQGGEQVANTHCPFLAILDADLHDELVFRLAATLHERGVMVLFCADSRHPEFPPEWASSPVLLKPVDRLTLSQVLWANGLLPRPQSATRERVVVQRTTDGHA